MNPSILQHQLQNPSHCIKEADSRSCERQCRKSPQLGRVIQVCTIVIQPTKHIWTYPLGASTQSRAPSPTKAQALPHENPRSLSLRFSILIRGQQCHIGLPIVQSSDFPSAIDTQYRFLTSNEDLKKPLFKGLISTSPDSSIDVNCVAGLGPERCGRSARIFCCCWVGAHPFVSRSCSCSFSFLFPFLNNQFKALHLGGVLTVLPVSLLTFTTDDAFARSALV